MFKLNFSHKGMAWTQLLVWVLIFAFPALMMWSDSPGDPGPLLSWAIFFSTWCVVYYLNYLVLVPRLLFRRRSWIFAPVNLLLCGAMILLIGVLDMLITGKRPVPDDYNGSDTLYGIVGFGIIYLFVILTAVAMRSLKRNKEFEQEKDRMAREQSEQELIRLKSQLNPHFLFNSLNNISALSSIDPAQTQQAIESLSSMLRYVLYDTSAPLVPLKAEAKFVHDYISLMSLRYTDRLKLEVISDFPTSPDMLLPPMLFISLVENAFKYGASSTRPSRITLEIREQQPMRLLMRITNTMLTPPVSGAAERARPEKHGVGLRNLRRRLEILFPGDHSLLTGVNDAGLYEASLSIPLTHA